MEFSNLFNTLTDKLASWLEALIAMLPNLAVAILVVVIFAFLSRGAERVITRLLGRVSENKQVNNLLSTSVYIAVLMAGIFIALGVLDLDKTVTSLLAGVGILGLALGFAFQDIAANFISGILLAVRRPYRVGDLIGTNDLMGLVERIDLRASAIRLLDGPLVYVPNKDIFENPIINYTERGQRRVDVEVGVAYDDDLALAKRTTVEAVKAIDGRTTDREPELFFTEFGGSSINLVVRFWISFHKQPDLLQARSEAIMRIKKAFDEAGLNIPFPIRTLDLTMAQGVLEGLSGARTSGNAGPTPGAA